LESIRRHSLVSEVVALIREVVGAQGLQPGDRLPTEGDLVRSLEVSRPVLREAISQLEGLGLIRVRRGVGMFVGDRDSLATTLKLVGTAVAVAPRELTQLADLQSALDHHGARRAAERATDADIAALSALCDELEKPNTPPEDSIGVGPRFQRALTEVSGNEVTLNVVSVLQHFLAAQSSSATPGPRDRAVSRRLRRSVLEALRGGAQDAAEAAMREHSKVVRGHLQKALRAPAATARPR
jgi:GntR family transcriptional repressor for pyruvate dehydrogenase complex